MVRRPQGPHRLRLRPVGDPVEHVHVQAALPSQQGREQADRARAGDQRPARLEPRAGAHPFDLFPGLGHHAGRLHQDARETEAGVDADGVVRLHGPQFGAVAVAALDAALLVAAVAAHVELAVRAGAAGLGVGAAHHARDQVAGAEPAAVRGVFHPAQRLVAEDQPVPALGRLSVLPAGDLPVGAAHAQREPADEEFAGGRGRLVDLLRARGDGVAGSYGQGTHAAPSPEGGRERRVGRAGGPAPGPVDGPVGGPVRSPSPVPGP